MMKPAKIFIHFCRLPGCPSVGEAKEATGVYQVYDFDDAGKKIPTMTRPAWLCQTCVQFARDCGLYPEKLSDA